MSAWLVQETDFIGPQIRIVALNLGIIAYMPRARGVKREQIRAQGHLVGCAVGPKSAAEVPVFPETTLMRHSILNDERLNALRVSKSQAKANWPTIVLHVEAVMCQAQRFGHMLRHGRKVVEGVRECGRIRPIAMAETRIIRGDQVIAVGQALQKRLIHPRRGWQAVKQKQGRGVFGPGLPVENGQVVDLHGAIRHSGVHRFLLLLVLSQNPAWSQQYQEKHCDDEKDGCFLVAMRVNTPSHLRSDAQKSLPTRSASRVADLPLRARSESIVSLPRKRVPAFPKPHRQRLDVPGNRHLWRSTRQA